MVFKSYTISCLMKEVTMNLSLNELTKMATQVNFDETFFTNIEECIKYNSIGTLNWAIHTLTIIRERIDVGQK